MVSYMSHHIEDGDGYRRLSGFLEDDEEDEWPAVTVFPSGYEYEDELVDQLAKLPSPRDVGELVSALRISALREFSTEVINGMIILVHENRDRLEHTRLINSWIATAEETVAAGRNHKRIAARRK